MNPKCLSVSGHHCTTPGYTVKPQTHNHHEIVFYDDGCNGKTIIDGQEYKFNGGDIVVNQSGSVHSEIHFGTGALCFLSFECDDFRIKNGVYKNISGVSEIFKTMYSESLTKDFKYEELSSLKLLELFILIERNMSVSNKPQHLISFKNFINRNYMNKINIKALAEEAGYSETHFRALFTQSFGISPQDYIIETRCVKAIELLKYTPASCAEIATSCGFYDSSQLTKLLKKRYSTTPKEIRNSETY